MNFFEQELRKIVGSAYPDATYIGRACYVRLGEENRAKIQFVTGIVSNQYNALQMTILNRSEGTVDTLRVSLTDLLGKQATKNPNFRNGVEPHIWDDNGNVSCMSISQAAGTTRRSQMRYRNIWAYSSSRHKALHSSLGRE